jgi:ADP-heptose:LPS heptosyltransferase
MQNWRLMLALLEKMHVEHTLPESPPQPDLSGLAKTVSRKGIVIHAGASRAYKRWPMERYIALANQLAADGHAVTWIDQGEQIELSGTIYRFKIGLLEDFIPLLANTALFIGNNSGPMNIASALGTPGIIFNGPSTPNWNPAWHQDRFELLADPALTCQPCDKLTHPVNACQNKVEPMACMNRWSVERVSEIATRMIKQHA